MSTLKNPKAWVAFVVMLIAVRFAENRFPAVRAITNLGA